MKCAIVFPPFLEHEHLLFFGGSRPCDALSSPCHRVGSPKTPLAMVLRWRAGFLSCNLFVGGGRFASPLDGPPPPTSPSTSCPLCSAPTWPYPFPLSLHLRFVFHLLSAALFPAWPHVVLFVCVCVCFWLVSNRMSGHSYPSPPFTTRMRRPHQKPVLGHRTFSLP